MRYKYARVAIVALAILLLSLPCLAQDDQSTCTVKKFTSASLDGPTGLFHTWDAQTPRKGELNFSLGANYTNRDSGRFIVRNFPLSFGYGIHDQVELFGSFDIQRSIGASGIKTYRVLPNSLSQPAVTTKGLLYYNNNQPFMDVPQASDLGDFRFGIVVNAMSEKKGSPLSVGIGGYLKIPAHNDPVYLNRGLTNGVPEGNILALFSKRFNNAAALHLNLGVNIVGTPEQGGVRLSDLQNGFIYRGGIVFPAAGKIQFIAELNGLKYINTDDIAQLNHKSPLDAVLGFKFYPREWISIGGGYQPHFNRDDASATTGVLRSGVHGFVAQVSFQKRKHDVPQATLAVSPQQIYQDEKAAARASVVIPEGACITYAWASSGGRLTGAGDTVTFDPANAVPGKYTITVTVADDYGHSVPATAEITVNKRYLPPTVTMTLAPKSIQVGETATARATATSPDGSPLTYSWTVNGQPQAASTPTFTFGSEGRQPGNYDIGVTVDTGKFRATAKDSVTVRAIPIPPPTIQCLTPVVEVESGSTVDLRVQAVAERAKATVAWSATGGTITGSDQTATFNASGLSAGSNTVTATVTNGVGGTASCTMTVNVSQHISVPGFAERLFRVNNVAKAILDNVAVQLNSNPRLRAAVAGYTDDSKREAAVKELGLKRAQAVVDYLVSKGVDASRLSATSGGVSTIGDNTTREGRAMNRRAEILIAVR